MLTCLAHLFFTNWIQFPKVCSKAWEHCRALWRAGKSPLEPSPSPLANTNKATSEILLGAWIGCLSHLRSLCGKELLNDLQQFLLFQGFWPTDGLRWGQKWKGDLQVPDWQGSGSLLRLSFCCWCCWCYSRHCCWRYCWWNFSFFSVWCWVVLQDLLWERRLRCNTKAYTERWRSLAAMHESVPSQFH